MAIDTMNPRSYTLRHLCNVVIKITNKVNISKTTNDVISFVVNSTFTNNEKYTISNASLKLII